MQWTSNPVLFIVILFASVLVIPELPNVLMAVGMSVALVSLIDFFSSSVSAIVRAVRRKYMQTNGYLALSDELASFIREGNREFSIRWSSVTRLRVAKLGRGRWRIRLGSRVASVDIVIEADERTIAALRTELKRRTGMVGTVGWGTSVRRTPGGR